MNSVQLIPIRLGRHIVVHYHRPDHYLTPCGRVDEGPLTVSPRSDLVTCGTCRMMVDRGMV